MRSLLLRHYTANKADNLKIAQKLARKIRRAQQLGNCLLINCEEVEVSREFLDIIISSAHPEKIKFSGLPRSQQNELHARLARRWCK